ncbi:hypothetical protein LCGC14_1564800, partial [marine sediment metagenome]
TITKDTLTVVPTNPFPEPLEMGYEYGAVYTFEYNINGTKSWRIVYDGKITDSLNRGVQLDNISLFFEQNDKYVNTANISTDNEGNFYVNHTVFGSIEMNALAKLEYGEDALYKKLVHEEYAGLEKAIKGTRFFRDENLDGFPDWPYSLHDLLLVLQGGYHPSINFRAQFDENFGGSTFDIINNLEGLIEGDINWTSGVYGTPGLSFDGSGTTISGGGGAMIEDYVDQISNVDGSSDKGTHDVFTDLQASDYFYDTISETIGGDDILDTDSFESGTGTWAYQGENWETPNWLQDTTDDYNWRLSNAGTPSGSTGASSPQDGSWFIYTEASSSRFGDHIIYTENSYEFDNNVNEEFRFYLNMYPATSAMILYLDYD